MPPPGYKGKRPSRPKRSRPKRSGPRRGAGGRRSNLRRSARRSAEARQDRARSGQASRRKADVRKGGESTGRERGIAAANKYIPNKKQKGLQQSVGSLDRRINTALQKGNTGLVKDLRSKQKKFVKKLGYERAHEAMINAAPLSQRDKIKKQIKANPNMLNTAGKEIFDETMDMDFLDPTRQIQNEYADQYKDMYPVSNMLKKGPVAVQGIKSIFGADGKKIPYTDPDMPGVRYPLDKKWGAYEKDPITTRSDRQGPLDEDPFTISNRQPGIDFFPEKKEVTEVTDKDRQAAIERGIDPNFIFSLPDDPTTEIVESDLNTGSALQLAEAANTQGTLSDLVEQVTNQKNLNVSPNVFALPEQVKEKLNEEAEVNRKEYEIETYGKEITEDDLAKANINPSYYEANMSTPLIQKQLFQSGVIDEKDVQAPIVKDVEAAQSGNLAGQIAAVPLDVAGFMGANLVPGYTDMTDYVREKAFAPQQQTQYTGEEWTNKVAGDKELALQNINNLDNISMDQKSSLVDFVNQGGADPNSFSLSDTLSVNPNFDTGVSTGQSSVDVLNSLPAPGSNSNYLKKLFGFNN